MEIILMATVHICRGTGTKKDTSRKACRGKGKQMSRVKDRSICRDSCRVRDKGRGRWTVDKSRNSLSISSMAKNMWLEGSQVQHSMMPDDFFLALTRQVMPQFLRFWPIFQALPIFIIILNFYQPFRRLIFFIQPLHQLLYLITSIFLIISFFSLSQTFLQATFFFYLFTPQAFYPLQPPFFC